jgi:hypothetical protein
VLDRAGGSSGERRAGGPWVRPPWDRFRRAGCSGIDWGRRGLALSEARGVEGLENACGRPEGSSLRLLWGEAGGGSVGGEEQCAPRPGTGAP